MTALRELTLTRIRDFLREPEALFWTFAFPILMALGLGLAFREEPAQPVPVAIEQGSAVEKLLPALDASGNVDAVVLPPADAARALRKGEVSLVLTGGDTVVYRYDPTRPESRTARLVVDAAIQSAAGGTRPVPVAQVEERQPGSRYIDWVIPGLIGLNLMSTGLWGIGFGIVTMRSKKQLKRLVATPMRRSDFLLAQVLARLVFLLLEVPPILLFAWAIFGVRVEGSLLALTLVILLGAMTFAGIGLLASSRARTIEGVSGIMNVVMLPMFIFSGVFFSSNRFPDPIQPFIQLLPLTALNDAMRTIYNDGLALSAATPDLLILMGWSVLSFGIALRLFRWR
ncbi:MAG TPA: ABC transporter permease [Longimicrobiaceae bacterium]|nr:ABC transporter permease [Longimicrobiaceae bacterium]